jgi:hypothetical protein
MIARLAATAVFTSLIFTTPSMAEFADGGPDLSLAQDVQIVSSAPYDLVALEHDLLAQLGDIDVPGPIAGLSEADTIAEAVPVPVAVTADATGDLALTPVGADEERLDATSVDVHASLSPEWFMDRDQVETFDWIAADLAMAADITTGSVTATLQVTDGITVTGDHGEFSSSSGPVAGILGDDALSFEAQAAP